MPENSDSEQDVETIRSYIVDRRMSGELMHPPCTEGCQCRFAGYPRSRAKDALAALDRLERLSRQVAPLEQALSSRTMAHLSDRALVGDVRPT